MSAAPINLRRLGAEDASAYREIRLEALADSPHAFSSTLESEQGQPLERFAARLADDFVRFLAPPARLPLMRLPPAAKRRRGR